MKYDTLGFIRIAYSYIYTKLFFKNAKIIRQPFDIRNVSGIYFGKGFTTGFGCRLEAYPKKKTKVLLIGENVQINDYVHITAMKSVTIGDNVLIASKVYISDCSHGQYATADEFSAPSIPPNLRPLYAQEVVIGRNVWLGEFVSVLPGVTIGEGTIVGANSVVTKSLPANVIAVGSPARPIKQFNFTTQQWEKLK